MKGQGFHPLIALGLYLTHAPGRGKTNVDRNCISNIREPHGLSYLVAVKKTVFLIEEALRRNLSGVSLKDESDVLAFQPKIC